MAIDFDAVIKDDKTYPDALEITLGTEKVQLGAIRELSKKQRQSVAEELSRVQAERTVLQNSTREALSNSEKAATILSEYQTKLEALSRGGGQGGGNRQDGLDPEALFDSDPWYAPVRKRTAAIEEGNKKLSDTVGQMLKTLQGAVNTFIEDRWEKEFESTADRRTKSKAIKDWDFDRLRKYAEENKVVDRRGIPSIRAAVERLTADEEKEVLKQQEYERGLREGEMRARLGATPRPASASGASGGGGPVPKDLDEAMSAESVASDPELSDMLSKLGVPIQ